MHRLFVVVLIALATVSGFVASTATAQQAINYLIRSLSSQVRDGQVVVEFTVINGGGAVTNEHTVNLFDSSRTLLASRPIPPLATGEQVDITLSTNAAQFAPDEFERFYVVIDLEELPTTQQSDLNTINVFIPASSQTGGTPEAPDAILPGLPLRIDLNNPTDVALVAGIIGVVVVLLWVLTVILRLLFSRPPKMGAWQPPYVITPLIDPNSTNGRRQMWQQHAQSDTLPTPCTQGNYMVRKLLIGSSGVKLSGWRVSGLRISQYDRYGRVARSETVLKKGTVKALDRAVRKSSSLDWERAQKAVRSTARTIARALLKKSNKKNAILPVALDIRFVGNHGEVRILFELYGCGIAGWQEIDHWEPEMRVVNGSIHENFTYTLVGQQPGEPYKAFGKRLANDLTLLLAAMVQAPPPPPPAEDTMETEAVAE